LATGFSKLQTALAAVLIALFFYFINPFSVPPLGSRVISIAVLMIILWVTEAMPMAAVALLPLIAFPLFNISTIDVTASSYSNPVIYLFLGGFMLGLAIEKWNLHRRIALNIVRITGTSGNHIIMGFIIATGLISMWLSNTATTMMMFPIAMSVIHVINETHPDHKGVTNFSLSVMIAIALSSNFGGIATIIGTPPNVAYVAFISKKYNYSIGFFEWIRVCLPISVLLLVCLYFVMVKWLYPNNLKAYESTRLMIADEIDKMGRISTAEKRVLVIFVGTALLWVFRQVISGYTGLKIDDNMIAVLCALALFIVPSGTEKGQALLDWSDTKKMAWGILLLFGGGIALASALEKAGMIEQIGQWFSQFAINQFMLILLVATISIFISEVMSNVAQVIVFAPVVSALADAAHMHPLMLGIPMTLAASCAGMLPMGTPPNAIAFSSGYIKLKHMTRVGLAMNIISILVVTILCWLFLPMVLK
jgi:solute carrier family 13 (sodium-dependent dicarboxylate transporter), member 2/3/5